MKIRMKVTAAGPGRYYMKGSIVDLAPEQAALYLKGGYAEAIETAEAAPAPEAAVEVTEAETTERAPEVETAAKPVAKPAAKKKKAR